jgi:aspartate/methionine/tyrosine aminotransferase
MNKVEAATENVRHRMTSEYLEWVKTRPQTRFSLATSGVADYSLAELIAATGGALRLEDLELSGPSFYGYEPLERALAAKCRVAPECVVAATGTSMANHLVMAATLEPGDEVLIEQPVYDPILAVARYFGATIKRFERRFEDRFRIDPHSIERALTPRTRLIALTNLHNPSGALTGQDVLRQVGELAGSVGAHVLVDEVYLEMDYARATPSAFELGGKFIVTGSLTKAYGLSGLRCGWILAEPDLACRMWRLNDLYGVIPAHVAERLSVVALKHLDQIAARARTLLETNRAMLDRFLDSRRDLEAVRPPFGTLLFPWLVHGSVDELCALLRDEFETTLPPGRFFEMTQHFRLGIGCATASLEEGLKRLGAALDKLASKS